MTTIHVANPTSGTLEVRPRRHALIRELIKSRLFPAVVAVIVQDVGKIDGRTHTIWIQTSHLARGH